MSIGIVLVLLAMSIGLFAWSLYVIAAPATAEERRLDDEEQIEYLRKHARERQTR